MAASQVPRHFSGVEGTMQDPAVVTGFLGDRGRSGDQHDNELRAAAGAMENPRWFHEPYLNRNREIVTALERGNGTHAEELLFTYLDDAERQLVAAYGQRRAQHLG
jgi:hypothetical protein